MSNILELVMIVKNSGELLNKCLESVKNYIDYWTIIDTGSSDNTINIIYENLSNIPGKLYKENFIDFSTTRNRAFELSSGKCKYRLVLDDSYVLCGGDKLYEKLKKSNKKTYSIKIENEENSYYSLRITKSDTNLKYIGRVHESINYETEEYIEDNDIYINDLTSFEHNLRTKMRYKLDIKNLLLDCNEGINLERTIYYLIKTYINLAEYNNALIYCKKLSKMNNIHEHYIFYAYYTSIMLKYMEINCDINKFYNEMLKLHKIFPNRAESLYMLCVVHNERKEYYKILDIMKKLLYIPIIEISPIIIEKNIYEYCIPYLFVDTNLRLGIYSKDIEKIFKKLLEKYPTNQPLLNIKYMFSQRSDESILLSDNKTLVINMGNFRYAWDPCNDTKISGSEYMAINLGKQFEKMGYRVIIFGLFEDKILGKNYEGFYDNIQYIDIKYFNEFALKYKINYLIISRYVENLIYYDNIDKVYLWIHDTCPVLGNNSHVIQTHSEKFKSVIVLNEWHKKYVMQKTGIPENVFSISRNAIIAERYINKNVEKIPYRFIYISNPSRGLNNLIDMISKIKEKYDKTTLIIFTEKEHIDYETYEKISKLDYIELHSKVTPEEISIELLKSDIWLYPTEFPETYCISALEAMAAGCLVCTTDYAGLSYTVGKRGILSKYPLNKEEMLRKLFYVLDNINVKEFYINNAKKWALEQTYENLAKEWENSLFNL